MSVPNPFQYLLGVEITIAMLLPVAIGIFVSGALAFVVAQRRTLLVSAQQRATDDLVKLCKEKGDKYWHLPAADVRRCVQAGADVSTTSPFLRQPILCQLVHLGLVDCLKACMETGKPINFTLQDAYGNNAFMCAVVANLPREKFEAVMQLFIYRLETHPRDVVDWSQKNGRGDDLLALAANAQLLAPLWRAVRHMPYYADRLEPMRVDGKAWEWDWEAIGEDQRCFAVPDSQRIAADRWTATLFKLSTVDFPDADLAQQCVLEGADVCFKPPGAYWPTLHRFLFAGEVACVDACLRSPRAIDFTVTDRYRCTPLHLVCRNSLDNKASEEAIMKLILRRITAHPEDTVDWSFQNDIGQDFITRVAAAERLALIWPLVKEVPYYRDYSGPIPIPTTIYREDWNQLSAEDQARFEPQKGFE